MVPAPISFEALDRFAARYGIVGAEFDRFLDLIDRMDDAYRSLCAQH